MKILKIILLFIFCFTFPCFCREVKKPDEQVTTKSSNSSGDLYTEQVNVWYKTPLNQTSYQSLISKIGWVYPINSTIERSVTSPKGSYKFTFTTNEYGLRIIPAPPNSHPTEHLIIAGDSNTNGQGVDDRSNTPYLLSAKYPKYHALNFGHFGGGPNNTLALMENYPWNKDIKETTGKMIYIYYPAWMNERVIGTKNYLAWDGGMSPWYAIENDKAVYKGSFRTRPLSYFLKFISVIDHFHWVGDLPKMQPSHMKLVAKVFAKMKVEYLKKFPQGNFIVAVSDMSRSSVTYTEDIVEFLKKENIEAYEIHKGLFQKDDEHFMDYHFNEKGQQMVADSLDKVIKF